MEILYLLVPLAMLIVALMVVIFFWAVRSGQFDDLEGPAHRIIMDDDRPDIGKKKKQKKKEAEKKEVEKR